MKQIIDTKVLVVDDDFLIVQLIERQLRSLGYPVVGHAKNGENALEMTHALKPDVILMDIEMPIMDGLEATRRIMEEVPTAVVMLTAYDGHPLVIEAGKAGAGAYVLKPPRPSDLNRAITIAVARFDDMMVIREKNERLEQALSRIKTLEGILPICAICKKIRDEDGVWREVASYLRKHSNAEFSHGYCPECAKDVEKQLD